MGDFLQSLRQPEAAASRPPDPPSTGLSGVWEGQENIDSHNYTAVLALDERQGQITGYAIMSDELLTLEFLVLGQRDVNRLSLSLYEAPPASESGEQGQRPLAEDVSKVQGSTSQFEQPVFICSLQGDYKPPDRFWLAGPMTFALRNLRLSMSFTRSSFGNAAN